MKGQKMKTKKEIEGELEVRNERIWLTWVFKKPMEFDYERGYIDALKWVLGKSR
jgi:hypothetical protein